MFKIPISKMDDKQLRGAVQLLYDELELMKRKYTDALSNLDSDNFSSVFIKEQKGFKSKILQTANSIELSVSALDGRLSKLSIDIDGINGEISDINGNLTTINADLNGIYTRVAEVESGLSSEISQRKDAIKMIVSDADSSSIFLQTANGFEMTGNVTVTGIQYVSEDLHIGQGQGSKKLQFNYGALIQTVSDGYGGYSALEISAQKIYLESKLDLSNCIEIDWGDNAPEAVFG